MDAKTTYNDEVPKKLVNVRLDPAILAKFDEVAAKKRRSRTAEIEFLIVEDIRSAFPGYDPDAKP